MSPDHIIVVADPVAGLPLEIGYRRPRAGVDEFFLIRSEERFRYRIVVTDPRPAQGPSYIILRAVGVEDR